MNESGPSDSLEDIIDDNEYCKLPTSENKNQNPAIYKNKIKIMNPLDKDVKCKNCDNYYQLIDGNCYELADSYNKNVKCDIQDFDITFPKKFTFKQKKAKKTKREKNTYNDIYLIIILYLISVAIIIYKY